MRFETDCSNSFHVAIKVDCLTNSFSFLFLQQDLYVRGPVIVMMQEHVLLEHAHARTQPTQLLIAVVGISVLKGCLFYNLTTTEAKPHVSKV